MSIKESYPWTNKPPLGTLPDLSHPRRRGLVLDVLMNEGAGGATWDYSGNGYKGTLVGGVTWTASRDGPALLFDGASGTRVPVKTTGPLLAALLNASIVALVNWTASMNPSRSIYCERAATGNDIWKLESDGGGTLPRITHRDDSGSLSQLGASSPTLNDGKDHVVAMTKAGTTVRFYSDGVEMGGSPVTLGQADTLTDAGLEAWIGGDKGDTSAGWPSSIIRVAGFNRTLPPAEVQSFSLEPWADWLVPTTRRWFVPIAAGTYLPYDIPHSPQHQSVMAM